MKSTRRALIAAIVAVSLAGCGEAEGLRNTVTLSLSFVDNQPIPETLPSGTGTVEVLSGTLRGSRFGGECTWILNFSDGSNPTGTVADCVATPGQSVTLDLDLGGPPGPSGSHSYRFGLL